MGVQQSLNRITDEVKVIQDAVFENDPDLEGIISRASYAALTQTLPPLMMASIMSFDNSDTADPELLELGQRGIKTVGLIQAELKARRTGERPGAAETSVYVRGGGTPDEELSDTEAPEVITAAEAKALTEQALQTHVDLDEEWRDINKDIHRQSKLGSTKYWHIFTTGTTEHQVEKTVRFFTKKGYRVERREPLSDHEINIYW
jgi:hypothetical protein